MGIELTVKLAAGLVQAIPQLAASLPQIIGAIVVGLGAAVTEVFEIGKNIVSGLWEGIKSMGSWIGEKFKGFFSDLLPCLPGSARTWVRVSGSASWARCEPLRTR